MTDPLFMGMTELHCVLFGVEQREECPTALMPWDWDEYVSPVQEQLEFHLHMQYQHAMMGRDWLRVTHAFGSHWFIQMWEKSPNDQG